jgi:fructuronate reductase
MALQVVGALASMKTGPTEALRAMTASTTELVTLTITEKGYEDTADHSAVQDGTPTAAALIARALAGHRRAGTTPPVFASLDNLLDNGNVLRARVLDAAEAIELSLAAWIAGTVRFPNSVVDRMVPAPTARDRLDIADELGLRDAAAVAAERHRSWVMQAVDGWDWLGEVGVELVDNVAPFERRKLWLLNGPHSGTAYAGLLAGCTTIAAAITEQRIARFVRDLVDETLQVAEFPRALQPAAFANEALRRFANPALGHSCAQVGADGSSKLRQRLLPVVSARQARALDTTRFATVTAIWLAATAGVAVRGVTLPLLDDPLAQPLRDTARRGGPDELSRRALGNTAFAAEVASLLVRLHSEGVAVLEATP